jgi:biopolymer transport protein ExbD
MAFGGSSRAGSAVSDINVTPLVDVLLVLLIIFMITAPAITKGPDVKLPGARQAGPLPIDESKLTVVVRRERIGGAEQPVVYFGTTRLDPAEMEAQIRGNARVKQDRSVFVQADEGLPYGAVQKIMGLLRQAGAERVGLVTDPLE